MVAWDDEQETRIYGFREVSRSTYDAVATLASVPPPAEHARDRSDELTLKVRDALATSFERTFYVAAADLAKTIVAASARILTLERDPRIRGQGVTV
jgi:hypothetical protein